MRTPTPKKVQLFMFLLILLNVHLAGAVRLNYFMNHKFTQPGCTIDSTNPNCESAQITGWSTILANYEKLGTPSMRFWNAKQFHPDSPQENAVQLNWYDNTVTNYEEKTCIFAINSGVMPGDYKLTFYAIIGQDAPAPIEEILLTRLSKMGPSGQIGPGRLDILHDFYDKLTQKGEKKLQYTITLTQFAPLLAVVFCALTSDNTPGSFALRDLQFIKVGNKCDLGTASITVKFTDNTERCVPYSLLIPYNCETFNNVSPTQVECASCYQNRKHKYLIDLNYGGNVKKVCGIEKGPNVETYQLGSNAFLQLYFNPKTCNNPTNSMAKVIAPSFESFKKGITVDQTGTYCGVDQNGVNLWDIVGEEYVPIINCVSPLQAAFLDSSTQNTFCADPLASYYSVNCIKYKRNTDGSYQCVECKPLFKLADVYSDPTSKTTQCLAVRDPEPQVIPFCSAYYYDQTSSKYYCREDGCSEGSASILIDDEGNYWCTKLTKYPFGIFQGCDFYQTPTISTTFLQCSQCTDDSLSLPYCIGTDSSSTCTAPAVEVTVADETDCADDGFISFCEVYENIDSQDKLYGCKQCGSNTLLVDLYIGYKGCVHKLINGCILYSSNGECFYFNPLAVVQPPAPINKIINCQHEVSPNQQFSVCNVCKTGYIRGFQGERCIKLVEYCALYSKGMNAVCTLCIKNYFLLNNQCIKKSPNCLTEDQSGKCQQCPSGFRLNNSVCEAIPPSSRCSDTQYRNSQGICVEGTVENCQTYIAATGECANCKAGFEFNINLECRPSRIICPNSDGKKKFFLQFTKCVETDVNCHLPSQDGSCLDCEQGFYLENGKCIAIVNQEQFESQEITNRLEVDDFGKTFYVDSNNRRVYLM